MAKANLRSKHKFRKPKAVYDTAGFRLGCLFLVLFSIGSWLAFGADFLKIKEVKIEGTQKISADEVKEVAWSKMKERALIPQNGYFTVPQNAISADILKKYPMARSAKLEKILPSTLKVKIEERQSVALWCPCDIPPDSLIPTYASSTATTTAGVPAKDFLSFYNSQKCQTNDNLDCYLIDNDCVAFENSHEFNFRIVDSRRQINMGALAMDKSLLSTILKIREKIKEKIGQESDLVYIFSQAQINFRISGSWWVYFNPKKDLDWQANALSAVYNGKLTDQEKQRLKYIDLRFENISVESEPEKAKKDK